MDGDIPVFRKSIRTPYGWEISPDQPLPYTTLLKWMKRLGVLTGFPQITRPYCLRYGAGNAFNQSGDVSDALQNMMMQHAKIDTFIKHYLRRTVTADTRAIHSCLTTAAYPPSAAYNSGVRPPLLFDSTLAPASRSCLMTAWCPFTAVYDSGVRLRLLFDSTLAPASSSCLITAECPPTAAYNSGVQSPVSLDSTLAPASSSYLTTAACPPSAAYNSGVRSSVSFKLTETL